LNSTTALYDLDYRHFDPILGRMNGVDPMADKYSSLTPYNYSFNSPTMHTDASGADPDFEPNYWYEESMQRRAVRNVGAINMNVLSNNGNTNNIVFVFDIQYEAKGSGESL
jgi:RHS repeat-associated protein